MTEEGRPDFPAVGISVHSFGEVDVAEKMGADFLIFRCAGAGTEELARICGRSDVPVYAAGDLGPNGVSAARKAGAAGICMMRELMSAQDPASIMNSVRRG